MDFELRIGQASDTGRVRRYNEDFVESVVPADETTLRDKGALFLVADGMGGHRAGGVASREAVQSVMKEYYANTDLSLEESLVQAFERANKAVFELAQEDEDKAGMGTTLVAAVLLGRRLLIANVGDSRLYLLRGRQFNQVTVDHSWVEEQVQAGLLTREEADIHPHRNLITRAMGTRPEVAVDLYDMEMREGDMLLLCTDGLSGQVAERQMANTVRTLPPPQAAEALVERANEQGGRDNATALIVQLGGSPTRGGLRQMLGREGGQSLYRRLALGLVALIFACLCALVALFPILNQRFVGNPRALPQAAPIRFEEIDQGEWARLAVYLGYTDTVALEAAHPDPSDRGFPSARDLWPAERGLFLVGAVQDWRCQADQCLFGLTMKGRSFAVHLEPDFLQEGSQDLSGQRVRVFGVQASGGEVAARLVDRGAPWWAWWQPSWVTVYDRHRWSDPVWVFSTVDQNPYSVIVVEEHPALTLGEPIVTRGAWLPGHPGDSMTFDPEDLYRLEDGVYVPVPGEIHSDPLPTATLQPVGDE